MKNMRKVVLLGAVVLLLTGCGGGKDQNKEIGHVGHFEENDAQGMGNASGHDRSNGYHAGTLPDKSSTEQDEISPESENSEKVAASTEGLEDAGDTSSINKQPVSSGSTIADKENNLNTKTNTQTVPSGNAQEQKAVHTACNWDSGSTTTAADCNKEGTKSYTCTVCGKKRTEAISSTSHNFVQERTPATCTKSEKITDVCSICRTTQEEKAGGGALGHDYKAEIWYNASCMSNGYYNDVCTRCKDVVSVSIPALEHTVVDEVVQQGDCTKSTIVRHVCSMCNNEIGSRTDYVDDIHDYSLADEYGAYCSRCGAR